MNIYRCDMDPRLFRLVPEIIRHFRLNLDGLTVYTEAASGPYLYTPILACCAGARQVIAYTCDSAYATAEEVVRNTISAAQQFGVSNVLRIVRQKTYEDFSAADIVTNTGFVRPIDVEVIGWMKPTAVIPLMWETWELRPDEIDLVACRQKGIVVLGTNEHTAPCDMKPYSGLFAMKLLFELGLEVVKCRVFLLGAQATLGVVIYDQLGKMGGEVTWFGSSIEAPLSYDTLRQHFVDYGACYDVILIADHDHQRQLIGDKGFITFAEIRQVNPGVRVGVISGNVDANELESSGLRYFPRKLRGAGKMSYQAGELGPRPVLELFAAGLKVGEAMARARIAGGTVNETVAYALNNSPAMDFPGENSWLAFPSMI